MQGKNITGETYICKGEQKGKKRKKRKKIRGLRLMQRRQRLSGRDLDNWEQQRVKRLPGENDGIL
jgi:cytochrome c oxidase assembly protein subunit 16